MFKKWSPLIGGIIAGFLFMALNYRTTVNENELTYKNNLVYVAETDKLFTGISQSYYENSEQLKVSAEYRKGKLNGETTEYYKNGTIKSKVKYKKGLINGKYVYYDERGNISEKGKYVKGEKRPEN